jgi:hypothetical protein
LTGLARTAILSRMDVGLVNAEWWSYADADRTVLTLVVVLVALAAAGYVGWRVAGSLRERKRR